MASILAHMNFANNTTFKEGKMFLDIRLERSENSKGQSVFKVLKWEDGKKRICVCKVIGNYEYAQIAFFEAIAQGLKDYGQRLDF